MARINEIKDQQTVVTTVGDFANSLQQIAAGRMVKLRNQVVSSRRFVEEATLILRELQLERTKMLEAELAKTQKIKNIPSIKAPPTPKKINTAIIVITSNQGLCGSYNTEILNRLTKVIDEHLGAEYFVLGHKGQAFMEHYSHRVKIHYYPFNIPEAVTINHLKPLIGMFYYYQHIYLMYSKYLNTVNREVVFLELAVPNIKLDEKAKEKVEGKFIFEPSLLDLISHISARVRYAIFRQQILDSKLSLYTSQMMAMKTAADNATKLLAELQQEYNKARRKLVDRKIQEVQAGRSLWAESEY